jgi:hypothetical protein
MVGGPQDLHSDLRDPQRSASANHAAEDKRALAVPLLRRAQNALAEHSEGCHLLGQVAQGSGTNWSEYFKALYHFEASVAQAYQFYDYASVAPESALA